MPEILAGILGVLFHEAGRVMRCLNAGRPFVPSAGFGRKVNAVAYGFAVLVFILVAIALTRYYSNGSAVAGFFFGVGIPSGARMIAPVQGTARSSGEAVDDIWSETRRATLRRRIAHWLRTYNA